MEVIVRQLALMLCLGTVHDDLIKKEMRVQKLSLLDLEFKIALTPAWKVDYHFLLNWPQY